MLGRRTIGSAQSQCIHSIDFSFHFVEVVMAVAADLRIPGSRTDWGIVMIFICEGMFRCDVIGKRMYNR